MKCNCGADPLDYMSISCGAGCEGNLSPLLSAWNYCPECGQPWRKDLEERPKKVGTWEIHGCSYCGRSKWNYYSFSCNKAGKHTDGIFDLECYGVMEAKGEWKYCPHCGQEKKESEWRKGER